jgi:hypothetical protein
MARRSKGYNLDVLRDGIRRVHRHSVYMAECDRLQAEAESLLAKRRRLLVQALDDCALYVWRQGRIRVLSRILRIVRQSNASFAVCAREYLREYPEDRAFAARTRPFVQAGLSFSQPSYWTQEGQERYVWWSDSTGCVCVNVDATGYELTESGIERV